MPKLIRLPKPSGTPGTPIPGGRRLSASKSTGDLVGLLKNEFGPSPLSTILKLKNGNENNSPMGFPKTEDLVVCGYLNKLTTTGIWFNMWVELRFNYLMGFYEQTDTLPIDVINLEGYMVRKAEECDHLEGLYPIKLMKKGERNLFFYTESEEGRMEWMSNFQHTANQQKQSLSIEGLNLEFDFVCADGASKRRRNSTVIRNIADKNVNDITVVVEEDETETNLTELEKTLNALKSSKFAAKIHDKYNRAETLAQHEALRLSTYYWQRRLSTQIKVEALEEQLDGRLSNTINHQKQIEELRKRLNEIDSCRERTERAVGQKLQELGTKRNQELRSANALDDGPLGNNSTNETDNTKVKLIQSEKKEVETLSKDLVDPPPTKPLRRLNLKLPKVTISRHSFSPGDRSTALPKLQKAQSESSFDWFFDEKQSPSPKSKRRSPLRALSNAIRPKKKQGRILSADESPLPSPTSDAQTPSNPTSPYSQFALESNHQKLKFSNSLGMPTWSPGPVRLSSPSNVEFTPVKAALNSLAFADAVFCNVPVSETSLPSSLRTPSPLKVSSVITPKRPSPCHSLHECFSTLSQFHVDSLSGIPSPWKMKVVWILV